MTGRRVRLEETRPHGVELGVGLPWCDLAVLHLPSGRRLVEASCLMPNGEVCGAARLAGDGPEHLERAIAEAVAVVAAQLEARSST